MREGIWKTIQVSKDQIGMRVDKALAGVDDSLSRTMIQRLIESGDVLCNGRTVASVSEKVLDAWEFQLHIPPSISLDLVPEAIDLSILFEDRDLIVINKPDGMVVHPGAGVNQGTLVHALLYHCGDTLSGIGGVARPGIVHRLDKDTSGLLVVAKNDRSHHHLSNQFQSRTISRKYSAITKGSPHPSQGEVEAPIGRNPKARKKMAVEPKHGRYALTHYTVLESLGAFSLIECRLKTGRTHQIRVHMAHKGHPLLGDPLYSRSFTPPNHWSDTARSTVQNFQRQALHAGVLGFNHPDDERFMAFEVPPPKDFLDLLNVLRKPIA